MLLFDWSLDSIQEAIFLIVLLYLEAIIINSHTRKKAYETKLIHRITVIAYKGSYHEHTDWILDT